ncbi:unnamed protein product [Acanthoscelides obtectus]|uniref:Uncharacterized protein n=1 Tax=Acanthoscelides obtectus TaxID=200917 RepID=A0A9P0Q5N3_ACAOB|nr:unnamed protein product [Acanthoscelides obtectus]CAK1664296.1 hypothetical protein AOBTE_LOCUS24183 [Acanthoscelides obtectus]
MDFEISFLKEQENASIKFCSQHSSFLINVFISEIISSVLCLSSEAAFHLIFL